MKIKKRGFTLIELLVVIAIIGLLSTMAVVSLNSARGKARDARRVSDVKQLSTILEMEAANSGDATAVATCVLADALTDTCTAPGDVDQFVNFEDPTTATKDTACTAASVTTCGYSISKENGSAAATVGDYQICFWLEQGAGDLGDGLSNISSGGVMTDGSCN